MQCDLRVGQSPIHLLETRTTSTGSTQAKNARYETVALESGDDRNSRSSARPEVLLPPELSLLPSGVRFALRCLQMAAISRSLKGGSILTPGLPMTWAWARLQSAKQHTYGATPQTGWLSLHEQKANSPDLFTPTPGDAAAKPAGNRRFAAPGPTKGNLEPNSFKGLKKTGSCHDCLSRNEG